MNILQQMSLHEAITL